MDSNHVILSRGSRGSTALRASREDRCESILGLNKALSVGMKAISVTYKVPIWAHYQGRAVRKRDALSYPVYSTACRCGNAYSDVKAFLGSLLEVLGCSSGSHPWTKIDCFRRLGRRERFSVAASLFSLRKCLPTPCCSKPKIEQHSRLLGTATQVSRPYLRHVRRLAKQMFPGGWDESYVERSVRNSPAMSACKQRGRSSGGCLSAKPGRGVWKKRAVEGPSSWDSFVRYCEVDSSGKKRGVTVCSEEWGVLRPVHKLIYCQLSRFSWLLRGEPTPKRVATLGSQGLWISGDYESATDNLSREVADALLRQILSTARMIPKPVMDAALRSLRVSINYANGLTVYQRRGQLMGNLLSFPLLCLQNYAAFRWVFPDKPVLINGDDILWRGDREEFRRWSDTVARCGLKLSMGKTAVHEKFGSINSDYFWQSSSTVVRLPVLRLGLLRCIDDPSSLAACQDRFLKPFRGRRKEGPNTLFLAVHRKTVYRSCRSLHFLGLRFLPNQLGSQFCRERAYANMLVPGQPCPEIPLPVSPKQHTVGGIPKGWRKVDARLVPRELRRHFRESLEYLLLERKWLPFNVVPAALAWAEYWDNVQSTGLEWYHTTRKGVRALLVKPDRLERITCRLLSMLTEHPGSRPFRQRNGPLYRRAWEKRASDRGTVWAPASWFRPRVEFESGGVE